MRRTTSTKEASVFPPSGGRWTQLRLVGVLSVLALASFPGSLAGQQRQRGFEEPEKRPRERQKVLLYNIDGLIDGAAASKLKNELETKTAEYPEIRFIFFHINSPGTRAGELAPAQEMAETIAGLRGITSVAYIGADGQAANGAALLAVACDRLVLEKGARIGFRSGDTEILDEREVDARKARAEFARFASLRKRHYPIALARALISKFHRPVFRVAFKRFEGESEKIEWEVLTDEDLESLKVEKKARMIQETKELLVDEGERRQFTSAEAHEYGLAEAIVNDRDHAFHELRILVGKEDVIDVQRGALKPASEGAQKLVDFLNHYVVRFLLLLGGFLALMLEFKMPGTFIPLTCSAGCFLIFFISGFFPVSGVPFGTTEPYEFVLFIVGMGLVLTELFVVPGIMFFGLLGVVLVIISLGLAMTGPGPASATGLNLTQAFSLLVLSLGLSFGLFFLLVRSLPRSSLFNRSGLITHASIQGIPTADSAIESQERSAALVGKTGTALTPLHPSGKIDVDGQILDVVAEGDFIDKGERVKLIEVSSFRAVVERVD